MTITQQANTASATDDSAPSSYTAASQMHAITQDRYGTAEVLEYRTVDRPTAPSNAVLIEVVAAAVDRGTCHLMTGTPYLIRIAGFGLTKPKNKIVGGDVAGRVVAVGADVTRFAVGDEVFGIAKGSLAEYAIAAETQLVHKPANVSFEHAAASAVSGITALQALTEVGKVEAGQRVLIVGASGGVGSFAVQLAKELGAEVTGVAGTRNVDLVRSLGADHVIDYTAEDFAASGPHRGVHRIGEHVVPKPAELQGLPEGSPTSPRGPYDLIIDIGGRNSVRRLRRVLTPTGTLVIVGGEGGNKITGGLGRQLWAMMLSPFIGQRLTTFISNGDVSLMQQLADHLESCAVTPAVQATFALRDAAVAIDLLDSGKGSGKNVIVVADAR